MTISDDDPDLEPDRYLPNLWPETVVYFAGDCTCRHELSDHSFDECGTWDENGLCPCQAHWTDRKLACDHESRGMVGCLKHNFEHSIGWYCRNCGIQEFPREWEARCPADLVDSGATDWIDWSESAAWLDGEETNVDVDTDIQDDPKQ